MRVSSGCGAARLLVPLRDAFCIVFFAVTFLAPRPPHTGANEAFVETGGGTVAMRDPVDTTVSLISQTIRIHLRSDHYYVDVSFLFFNEGPGVRHDLGFPRFAYGTADEPFADFRSWVNDEPVPAIELPDRARVDERIRSWYVKEVVFPENRLTATRVRYRSEYGRDRLASTVEYIYGTGGTWSGEIGEITVRVFNEAEHWVDSYAFEQSGVDTAVDSAVISVGPRDFEISTATISPQPQDTFRLVLEPVPWWLRTTPSEGERWAFERTELKPDYLRLLTLDQLRILRNAFYARQGYDLCTGELGSFFRRFAWYDPRTTNPEGLLGPMGQLNVHHIVTEEERRRTILMPDS